MKTPTLEEVKEHFKDAYLCQDHSKDVFFIEIDKIQERTESYIQNQMNDNWGVLYLKGKGFAKILTYKEKTKTHNFPKDKVIVCGDKLGTDELKEVYALCFEHGLDISESILLNPVRKDFPYIGHSKNDEYITLFNRDLDNESIIIPVEQFKAFIRGEGKINEEVKIEVGKWYKYPDYQKWNLCITEIDQKSKRVKGFGFGADGEWMENALNDSWDFEELNLCVEMHESEVKEALIKEAVKRGYKKGNHNCLNSPITESCLEDRYDLEKGLLWYGGKYANCVFKEGKWTEIIETITRSEAEKQLGKKIID